MDTPSVRVQDVRPYDCVAWTPRVDDQARNLTACGATSRVEASHE